jgi:hypothetical protein
MSSFTLDSQTKRQLAALYSEMEKGYQETSRTLGLSCAGCPDNCCDSYFTHHTYIEWAYLWEGLASLPEERLAACRQRAAAYDRESERLLAKGKRPHSMCPLNEQGRCILYDYRLMICRLHGVPAGLTRPDGRRLQFPGCFRCQELTAGKTEPVLMERTTLLQRLAQLEMACLGAGRGVLPKVKMTLARMILQGPPQLRPGQSK